MTNPATTVGSAGDFGLSWPHRLFPFQRTGVRALLSNSSLLLADHMGLGKTIQVIAALRCLFATAAARAALVVVPAGVVLQWRRELRLWAPQLRLLTVVGNTSARAATWQGEAQVFIASYETVRTDLSDGEQANREWDVVIVDEVQRIKNPEAEISRAVKRLPRRRGWALSGTPLENRLDDLISVLDFVAPGRFQPGIFASGLRRLLGEVQLRRRVDVLQDLLPKLPAEVLLDLEPQQRAAYNRAEREGIIRLNAPTTIRSRPQERRSCRRYDKSSLRCVAVF